MIEPLRIKKTLIIIVAVLAIGLFVAPSAAAWARGYLTDDAGLKPGMVVALNSSGISDDAKVKRASRDDTASIIGIATNPANYSVTLASEQEEVYVETSGEVTAFVTDIYGEIKKGDKLTISPLNGILAKAPANSALILGVAIQNMSSNTSEEQTIDTDEGTRTVKVASIVINFDRDLGSGKGSDSTLARVGRSIVGRDISDIRVAAALLVFLVVLIAEASILYGAISSAITSLGRNPLARKIIKHELLRVVIVAAAVLLFGLGSIYLILWI
jgi:hypothetical protein